MKNSKILTFLFILTIAFTGCDSDEFLEQVNRNELNADLFWQNTEQVEQGLIASYAVLQFTGVLGSDAASQLPVRSDIGRPNNWNANARSLQNLDFNDNTEIVKQKWDDCYEGIFRTNQVLDNLGAVETDSDRQLIEAEARFLRGFYYYVLYQGYNNGSVIIHTTVPKTQEEFNKTLSPREEVFALIQADFEFAQNNLPETRESGEEARVTWGAATSMLGKLWINERQYELARSYFQSVIESGLYSLTAEIGWNFDEEHELNSESIFEVAFSNTAKSPNAWNAADGPTGSEGTSRNYTLGPQPAGGFRIIMPSYWMTMVYKSDSMDMSDPRYDEDDVYSLRTSASIAIADDTGTTFYQRPSNEGGQYNNKEASYVKKLQNWQLEREHGTFNSGINERVIRLADIYLLYAETIIETGGSIDEAISYINLVRDRAGVTDLNVSDFDAASLMEHLRWVERPLELMFEGHDIRWEDLRRWGAIKEQYDRLASYKFTLMGQNIRWFEDGDDSNNSVTVVQEFIEAAAAYQPSLHDYFPIPVTEKLTNPNLD